MDKKKQRILLQIFVWIIVLGGFLKAILSLDAGQGQKTKEQIETAIRRAAVTCYAVEGAYPENLEYMQEHYGIRYDEERYTVMYMVFASNLMPDITVLDNE